MIKCEVIEKFDLGEFEKLQNIKRKSVDIKGKLFVGDEFECDEEMARYLTGENPLGKVVVKIIEVEPEKEVKVQTEEEIKTINDTTYPQKEKSL